MTEDEKEFIERIKLLAHNVTIKEAQTGLTFELRKFRKYLEDRDRDKNV